MPAVTLDLWHTLMYLRPEDEETYMVHQLALGEEVLSASPSLPGAPALSDTDLGRAFEQEYVRAVTESTEGRTVTPAEQLLRAGREVGRKADPQDYLARLKSEVDRTSFRRAPGALGLLKELRGDGYRVGVISNTIGEPGAFLRPVLARMGFDRYVETYVFSDEQPWTKPSPEIFRLALDRLNGRPEEAVHVGDGWSDIEGARRAGFRGTVLFTGLQAYGDRYRKLFLSDVPEESTASYRTDRLGDVAAFVRTLLPRG